MCADEPSAEGDLGNGRLARLLRNRLTLSCASVSGVGAIASSVAKQSATLAALGVAVGIGAGVFALIYRLRVEERERKRQLEAQERMEERRHQTAVILVKSGAAIFFGPDGSLIVVPSD